MSFKQVHTSEDEESHLEQQRASSIGGDDGRIEVNLSSDGSEDKRKERMSDEFPTDLELIGKLHHDGDELNQF